MPIVSLAPHHATALHVFLADFAQAGEDRIPAFFPPKNTPHDQAVASLAAWSRGERLQPGWVPCTTAFFEENGVLKGVVNVRHHLDDTLRKRGGHVGYSVAPTHRGQGVARTMLRWALHTCRSHGVDVALVTTHPDNIASQKVIEACGGVLVRQIVHPDGNPVLHYDVPTPPIS